MLKEYDVIFRQLMIALDLAIVAFAFFIAHDLRNRLGVYSPIDGLQHIYPIEMYLNLLPLMLILWWAALVILGTYRPLRGRSIWGVVGDILKAGLVVMLFFGGSAYLLKLHYLSRSYIALIIFLSILFLSAERLMLIQFLQYIRRKGYNYRHVLIVGTGRRAQNLIDLLHDHSEWGLRIVGLVDVDPHLVGKVIKGHKVLGVLSDVPELFEHTVIDEVVFIVPRSLLGKIEEAILFCEQVGKRVSIAMDLFSVNFAKAKESSLHGFPLLMFQSTSDKLWELMIKIVLDYIIAAVAVILLTPFFIIVAILIQWSSPGPILFKQQRCGLNGRRFMVYKFRTMIPDAEAKLESFRTHNEMTGPVFKMTNDPRLIRFGRWMRKFSIDELPQLFNILRGEMSIVGPRPPIPSEVKKYEPWQRRRLSMRPGLTCIWQIKGRNKLVNFNEWMKLDLEYIDHWSLWLDLKIFLRTIPVVLFGIGAK
ncbi:MAG: sugar transferase [Candidatus Omnitrophica bacterium]|nr:sugar transferase [Candidatus Omnitrophota bacterium]